MTKLKLIWVRGAGELGSAAAHLLHRIGFRVFLSEIDPPRAIRRPVTFSDALIQGHSEVEGVLGKRYADDLPLDPSPSHIPVFKDHDELQTRYHPDVLVDARMLKHYTEDFRSKAALVIGLGPGFDAGKNCHRVIETMRGHDLARVITNGKPMKDTGIPGVLGGETSTRIIRAPRTGTLSWTTDFGELVFTGQVLGSLGDGTPIISPLNGMVRGLISPHTPVSENMKIGDVDPRGESVNYTQISEKARAVASGVLEAILLDQKEEVP